VLIVLAALPVLFLAGCTKEKADPTKPSITWTANPGFSTVELADNLDAKVTVQAPGKFKELSLVLGLGQYNILANRHIQLGNNTGTATFNPVLNLVEDSKSISFMSSLGVSAGSALSSKEQLVLDLKKILESIIEGQIVENNTTFSIEIKVKDQADNMASKTARFHFTAAPTISWKANESFKEVDLDASEIDCKVEIWAPGKIGQLTVKLEDGADASFIEKVKNRTTDNTTLIDLINDPKASTHFKFPASSSISGKEQTNLDFGFLYDWVPDMKSKTSTNTFTITAVDKNGKETVKQVRFVKK